MAESDDFNRTLTAATAQQTSVEEVSKAKITEMVLSEMWESVERAVDAIVLKNETHGRENVAIFAAEKAVEIAKTAAYVRAEKIIKEEKDSKEKNNKQRKEHSELRDDADSNAAVDESLNITADFDTFIPARRPSDQNSNLFTKRAGGEYSQTNVHKEVPRQQVAIKVMHPWKKLKTLGKGAYGEVFLGEDKNGMKFAAKEVPESGMLKDSLSTEIEHLSKLSHENVVKYLGYHSSNGRMYMYMELMKGSIKDKMDQEDKPISVGICRKYTKQLLRGLIYLHSKGIIHRDIKCANVLLDDKDCAKLADMGVSKVHVNVTLSIDAQSRAGSCHWMSPEVINGKEGGKRSDVWSVGCTVYEMFHRQPPFAEIQGHMILCLLHEKTTQMKHKDLVLSHRDMDPKLKEFFLAIFVTMDQRPFADRISEHAWLR